MLGCRSEVIQNVSGVNALFCWFFRGIDGYNFPFLFLLFVKNKGEDGGGEIGAVRCLVLRYNGCGVNAVTCGGGISCTDVDT